MDTHDPAQPIQPEPNPDVVARKRTHPAVMIGLVAFLVLLIGGFWWLSRNEPGNAAAGDCVRPDGPDSVVVVACSDPAAEYKVLGRIEGISQNELGMTGLSSPCTKDHPDATAHFWQGPADDRNADGWVLCLADAKA